MPTESKSTFDFNLQRSQHFIDLHMAVHAGIRGAPLNPVRELPRAALVFAIGALDAYLSEVTAEVLVAQFEIGIVNEDARDVLKKVQGVLPTASLELTFVQNQDERIRKMREMISNYYHSHVSNHGKKAVARTVTQFGGVPNDLWNQVPRWGQDLHPADQLDDWTNRRHRMVHQGEVVGVIRADAIRCAELVQSIGELIDQLAVTVIADIGN